MHDHRRFDVGKSFWPGILTLARSLLPYSFWSSSRSKTKATMAKTRTPITKPAAYRSKMAIDRRHLRNGAGAGRYKDVVTRVRLLCPSRNTSPARLVPDGPKNLREAWSTGESQKQVYAAAVLPDGVNSCRMRSEPRYTKSCSRFLADCGTRHLFDPPFFV